jgi:hypothetical protein
MHQPGYVQGGQEVGRSYLLLGIHYRRIRKHSTLLIFNRNYHQRKNREVINEKYQG